MGEIHPTQNICKTVIKHCKKNKNKKPACKEVEILKSLGINQLQFDLYSFKALIFKNFLENLLA